MPTKTKPTKKKPDKDGKYRRIILHIFQSHYSGRGKKGFGFDRDEISGAALALQIKIEPKNFGDLIYTFRYRAKLPPEITKTAPRGKQWVILPDGISKYRFALFPTTNIMPSTALAEIKIPDATPGVVVRHKLTDEQALLARVRYNRLIDLFTGVVCYSLQNHLRTTVQSMGQIEIDELYVGVDQRGAHHVFPVQAKRKKDKIGIVQVIQDIGFCEEKFPDLVSLPIAAQFMEDDLIALFAFGLSPQGIAVEREKHYRLVAPDEISDDDLVHYRKQLLELA